MKILCSGYTNRKGQGIYQLLLKDDQLSSLKLLAKVTSPTYMRYDPRLQLLFAVDKNDGQRGGIAAFKYQDERLIQLDRFLSPGTAPAYIGINRQKQLLYTANYHTAVISVFSYQKDGKLNLLAQRKIAETTLGPRPEQESAHPHFFDETPQGELVCCDLGNDKVYFFTRQGRELQLSHTYRCPAGFGPRHLVFGPRPNSFYVIGELASQIDYVCWNGQKQCYQRVNTYSTIPQTFTAHNGAAAIRLSRDQKYLYASNRGHNSIVVFKIKDDGNLQLTQRISSWGDFPRDFNWNHKEDRVLVANQKSDNACLYKRDADNGSLTPIIKDFFVPEATCVVFIEDQP